MEIKIKFGKKGITLLIMSSLFACSIGLVNYSIISYYVYGSTSTFPLEYYKKALSNRDVGTLKQLIRVFYPIYQGLYNIGYNAIQKNLTSIQIQNQTFVDQANYKAKCNNFIGNKTQCINPEGSTY